MAESASQVRSTLGAINFVGSKRSNGETLANNVFYKEVFPALVSINNVLSVSSEILFVVKTVLYILI